MKILYATDGSPDSLAAIDLLRRLRWTPEDRLVVVSVVPHYVLLTGRIDDGVPGRQGLEEDEEAHAASEIVRAAAERLKPVFTQVETRIHAGFPSKEILDAAGEMEADLIVLGSRGKTALKGWFLGSVSRSVLERADCSVLIARPNGGSLNNVLLAFDGSTESEAALNRVKRLGLPDGARVRVVSVSEPVRMPAAGVGLLMPTEVYQYTAAVEEHWKQHAERAAAHAVRELQESGIRAEATVQAGNAMERIHRLAQEWPADLTVLGSHAKQGWIQNLLGNTARAVAQHARGAVLVARSQSAHSHDWLQEWTVGSEETEEQDCKAR
ncbi:MAG: universal stress protein [Armatimonadetes bacterium]|nr:universal stress protein [Armatimonadota bacterium]